MCSCSAASRLSSANVANAVTAAGFNAIRLGGNNRFETAVKVATDGLGSPEIVLVATGRNFPDALGAGPAAAVAEGAILLSDDATLPPSTSGYLQQHPDATVFAIGGQAAAALPSADASIVGADRYETAVKVAQAFFLTFLAPSASPAASISRTHSRAGRAWAVLAERSRSLRDR